MKKFFIVLFLFFPCDAFAEGVGYFSYTLKALGSLILVLGVIVVFFYLLKKISSPSKLSSGRLRLKGRLYLDNKHSLAIVEIDKKELLIGIADNITLLKELDNEKND